MKNNIRLIYFKININLNEMKFILKLVVFICMSCLIIILLKNSFKDSIYAGKSNWPGWDLFEYSQKNQSIISSYTIKFKNYTNYQQIINAYVSGEINIATITLFEALHINQQTNNDSSVILLLDYTMGSDAVIAQNNIEYLNQLKGKTIGIETNTTSFYTLSKALQKANLKKSDVNIKELELAELIHQFKLKKLDAISLYDPYIFELMEYQKDLNIIFSSKEIPREICDVVLIRKDIIKKHPNIIENIQKNWYKLMSKELPFKKLNDPIYKNNQYISHVQSNIYFANKNENIYAFGNFENPGYLNRTIKKIQEFQSINNETTNKSNINSILYLPK